jgi:hypothetical protein
MSRFRTAQEYTATTSHAVHAAATATEERVGFVAPCKCRVVKIGFVSDAAGTGDNTNTTNVNILNKGAAGAGTTEVANKDFVTGENIVAFDREEVPLNTTYANGVDLAEGDVLSVQYEKVGTGLLIGPATFVFDYVPT